MIAAVKEEVEVLPVNKLDKLFLVFNAVGVLAANADPLLTRIVAEVLITLCRIFDVLIIFHQTCIEV